MFIKKAFTLIELLVVLSIISLLSSIVFTSTESIRSSGRDTNRTTQIREMQKALELYYAKYNRYPNSGSCYQSSDSDFVKSGGSPGYMCNSVDTFKNGGWIHDRVGSVQTYNVLAEFLTTTPVDPQQKNVAEWSNTELADGGTYFYWGGYSYGGCEDFYILYYGLEEENGLHEDANIAMCDGTSRGRVWNNIAIVGNTVN